MAEQPQVTQADVQQLMATLAMMTPDQRNQLIRMTSVNNGTAYWNQVNEEEKKIRARSAQSGDSNADVLVESLDHSDGGKAGRLVECSPRVAAVMIVDKRAILAAVEKHKEWLAKELAASVEANRAAAAAKIQVTWAAPISNATLETATGSKGRAAPSSKE